MKTIRSYQNIGEAGFAQSLLEAAGIPAVLQHEAAAVFAPMGVCAARLEVPEENAAEADRILAEHPVHFADMEDVPRFGFWRGSAFGLLAYLFVVAFLLVVTSVFYFNVGLLILVSFVGGIVGVNHRTRRLPQGLPKV
jgi:hypothetical protein